ncbi:MAG: site-2 protease family protein [Microcystaceae cyanobacterium]
MNGNIKVGNLFGIPFYVNPSWFLVLGLVTLSYGGQLANFPQLTGLTPWLLGLIAALLLFASVVAHELGHSFVAISQGVGVKSITLFLFGGLASLEKEAETPLQSFLIAIAGPVVSLLLFVLFTLVGLNFALPAPLLAIISLLGSINLVLGLFNLIPGLPLDGGNILKSIVWKATGNPNQGVIFASRVGQVFGWTAIALGGLSILGISQIGSFWTLLIGFFLLQNAGMSAQSAKFQETVKDYTAEDAIIPNSPVVTSGLTLRQFVNDYVIGQREWKKFLVTDEVGQLLGTLTVDELKTIHTSQWNEVLVKDLVRVENNLKTVKGNQPLLEVIKRLEEENIPQLTVLGDNGNVLGLLEKTSVIQFLQRQVSSKTA